MGRSCALGLWLLGTLGSRCDSPWVRPSRTVDSIVSERSESNQWLVYIVRCSNGSLYTGVTRDINRRLQEHNSKHGGHYTSSFGPVTLLWKEDQVDHSSSLKREAQIKRLTRPQKLTLIAGDL